MYIGTLMSRHNSCGITIYFRLCELYFNILNCCSYNFIIIINVSLYVTFQMDVFIYVLWRSEIKKVLCNKNYR